MGFQLSKIINYEATSIKVNLADTRKMVRQITAVIDEKIHNGFQKLLNLVSVHNKMMLIHMLILSFIVSAFITWHVLYHCRSKPAETGVVDQPPAYSIDTPGAIKKSSKSNEDEYKV